MRGFSLLEPTTMNYTKNIINNSGELDYPDNFIHCIPAYSIKIERRGILKWSECDFFTGKKLVDSNSIMLLYSEGVRVSRLVISKGLLEDGEYLNEMIQKRLIDKNQQQ